ncbi:hypothetical protein HN695_04980 [Candidatus Woesearchaeota archaeon]|jgi:hypothetical protein|nr:hypothetical protein [Candidatus Woesearchaeota archaeon]MBT5272077.1 hypothetical protein [Candidatus Woesearchaeota archaeon]MBT6041827.1 hypothetical protein [Candidatus Woesearchaeota archaeon]MBT6336798.1 hypothetical protein [Candidatus Woesearchaeota archaeon]MBT7927667.1 hypothetical protein [Candidatus Woesearchaeota archaeon]
MFNEDFVPEELSDFKEMYMVQNYQMICMRLNKRGVKVRRFKHTESKAS